MRLALGNTVARDGWEVAFQSNAVGVTDKTQRLRWSERQDRAPSLDLADYRLQLSRGPIRAAVGNLSVGTNRYLLSGFGSRGASAAVQLHRAVAIDAAAVNGTNVVGWDNVFGLAESDHRLVSTGLNVELIPSRPGRYTWTSRHSTAPFSRAPASRKAPSPTPSAAAATAYRSA
ncbi:MAG: hypothetical protein IPJ56_02255 [Gemmatimonadetes bacterium]|nr:hypothetical protein [Gemmatimonadota bacterium]